MSQIIRPGCAQDHARSSELTLRERFRKQVRRISVNSECKQEGCALDMGVDPSLISHWGKDCDMPAWRLISHRAAYGPELLQWIASQNGDTYIPGFNPMDLPVTSLIGLLAQHSGHTVNQLVKDLDDHVWTPEEKASTLPGLRKLREIVDTLIFDAEGGVR